MASTPVKVLVIVPQRTFTRDDGTTDVEPGFWCCGRFWPNGETETILEDDPPGEPLQMYNLETQKVEVVARPGLTVAQKLRQLKDATGGKTIILPDGNKIRKIITPALLAYRVMGEVKPEQRPSAGAP